MKVWAVVIGRKDRHQRYVAKDSGHFAIYKTRAIARMRQRTMQEMGYEHVYVIPFVEVEK